MSFLKRTWAEIHLDRLDLNLENFRRLLPRGTKLMCVVKASCYGHSDLAVCPHLQEKGVDMFAVSNVQEAVHLRKMGIDGEILILGYTPPEAALPLAEYDIIQTVTETEYAFSLAENLTDGRKIRCHTAIDTGMSRIGLHGSADEIAAEYAKIAAAEGIIAEGIFTHFAAADSPDNDDKAFTARQAEKFAQVRRSIEKLTGKPLKEAHCLNSAGAVYGADSTSTIARLGIILYGLMPDPANPLPFEPLPVMDLRSVVSQVKDIDKGVSVSYGRTFTADRKMRIATVCCGYADGYPRSLSNKGYVLIRGRRAPIVGRVCMDQFMCDVSDIDGVRSGDVVTLIGKDGDESITADGIAALTGTIGYEIVCGISSRVPRVVFENDGKIKGEEHV